MYKIKIIEKAYNDIENIASYIYFNLSNPQASNRFVDNIFQQIEKLKDFPFMGSQYLSHADRFLVYKKYLIFYEIQEKKNKILIKTIMHSKQNRKKHRK